MAKKGGGRIHRQAICMYNAYICEPYDNKQRGVGTYTEMGAYSRDK